MSVNPIVVEGVSKRYRLGDVHDRGLKESLETLVRTPAARRRYREREGTDPSDPREFWALRDISLEVEPGEVLGLIGGNGAGKTTLLKLLSRITSPTEGRITMLGRVGALLEVGTGFHPELTGRDNVFLNGSILGMRRHEIAKVFDEIVEFSGIERFIDTPVKRYSSGMFVRLAFAVAAHLRTDILLLDEVLSVGDAEFQRKSLGKMDDAAAAGRTVVYVSHRLASVQRHCQHAVWLDKGKIAARGPVTEVIGDYLERIGPKQEHGTATINDNVIRQGSGDAFLREVSMTDQAGRATDQLMFGEPLAFSLEIELRRPIPSVVTEIGISSADGTRVVGAYNTDRGRPAPSLGSGRHRITVGLNARMLPGEFKVDFGISEPGGWRQDYVEGILTFRVVNRPEGDPDRYPWPIVHGSVRADSDWSVAPVATEASRATTPQFDSLGDIVRTDGNGANASTLSDSANRREDG